jgi:hypothetical protein
MLLSSCLVAEIRTASRTDKSTAQTKLQIREITQITENAKMLSVVILFLSSSSSEANSKLAPISPLADKIKSKIIWMVNHSGRVV